MNSLAHKIACRNDVAWMFEQWDGDNDGLLSKDELMPLEGNGRESCLAQFIDMCGKLSLCIIVQTESEPVRA
uniref:SPARC Testican domain containing protein n=1 Tax=Haemonchus contortus TaxID=6289 RepID=W6NH52_HAECO